MDAPHLIYNAQYHAGKQGGVASHANTRYASQSHPVSIGVNMDPDKTEFFVSVMDKVGFIETYPVAPLFVDELIRFIESDDPMGATWVEALQCARIRNCAFSYDCLCETLYYAGEPRLKDEGLEATLHRMAHIKHYQSTPPMFYMGRGTTANPITNWLTKHKNIVPDTSVSMYKSLQKRAKDAYEKLRLHSETEFSDSFGFDPLHQNLGIQLWESKPGLLTYTLTDGVLWDFAK